MLQQNVSIEWNQYIETISTWEKNLLQNIKYITSKEELNSMLSDPDQIITFVSDGGSKDNIGSYGWILATTTIEIVKSQGQAMGQPMSSHRAEGYGKLAWLTFLRHYSIYHNIIIQCIIHSFCDNKAVVEQTQKGKDYAKSGFAMIANYDVLLAVTEQQNYFLNKNIKLKNSKHVMGHQDKSKTSSQLTRPEYLNICADELASNALQNAINNKSLQCQIVLPHCKAYLSIDNQIQSSGETDILRWRYQEFKLQKYLCSKWDITINDLHTINWAGYKLARNKLSVGAKVFSTKFSIEWLAVGERQKLFGNAILNVYSVREWKILIT